MRWLARHLASGLVFAVASVGVAALVRRLLGHSSELLGGSLISTLAGGLLVYGLVAVSYQALAYHRVAREREAVAARLRADLAEARLTTLEGKLHPHFLFNALNSIAALVRIDQRQAETMLEQLSELLRATLRTNPMQEVSLEEALHLTEQYLAIERVRFQDRLRATVEASGAARQGRVPQLILQPLVENAVRHGIAPLESGGSVTVTARVDNDTLLMTVEDDGVGFGNAPPERAGTGLGLSSVRKVLAHLYGSQQRFDVRARTPTGTTVTIAMPYRTAAA
jgi:LytS/YehU family sensor histidine kinase